MANNIPSAATLSNAFEALAHGEVKAAYPRAEEALREAAAASPALLAAEASKINVHLSRDLRDAENEMPDHQTASDALSALVREIVL